MLMPRRHGHMQRGVLVGVAGDAFLVFVAGGDEVFLFFMGRRSVFSAVIHAINALGIVCVGVEGKGKWRGGAPPWGKAMIETEMGGFPRTAIAKCPSFAARCNEVLP